MYSYLVFFFLFGLSSASQRVERFYDDEVDRGDEFIDQLLHDMIHDHGDEYDPYPLEDSKISFSKKVLFVNVTGEAKLHKGYIKGLRTLHRPNHCSIHEEDNKLYVDADLGAGVLDFHYDGTVKFMNWGPTISVFGKLSYLETHMEFSVDAKTGKDGKLEKFYIDDMKGMEVWITGLGPLNWAVNYLISGVTSLFKGYIKHMLESQVRNHLDERLPNYRFPVDDATVETTTILEETSTVETTTILDETSTVEKTTILDETSTVETTILDETSTVETTILDETSTVETTILDETSTVAELEQTEELELLEKLLQQPKDDFKIFRFQ